MADPFSILSRELSKAERKLLLARILSSAPGPSEQETALEPPEEEKLSVSEEYTRMSFVRKLILVLKSFFTQKPVHELTEELLFRKLKSRIEARAPGLIDFNAERFSAEMKREVEPIGPVFSFMRSALAGIPKQKDFIAFLAGIVLNPLNDQILLQTDPHGIYREPSLTEERAIRSEMWDRFERIVSEIPKEKKAEVQRDLQRLQTFDALATIRIEEATSLFSEGGAAVEELPGVGGPTLHELGSRLMRLCDAIEAVRNPPSAAAWNALFLYRASNRLESPEYDVEGEATAFISRVGAARKAILEFGLRVPLIDIMRFILRDLSFHPRAPKGGEEWFVLFKSFWEDHLEAILRAFSLERRRQACVEDALALLGIKSLPYLENYRSKRHGEAFSARIENSLAFMRGFHEALFLPKMDRFIRLVNINGDFYKEENRAAFTDCHEKILAAYQKAERLDNRLSDTGDLGKRIAAIQAEGMETEIFDKIHSIAEEANTEARRISDSLYSTLCQLSRILFGILFGEAGSPYDSITNLNTIGGRENKAILKGLEESVNLLDRSSALLAQLRDIEIG